MIIYHGSKLKITKPLYKGSKEDNDYGPAFYTTRDLASAHEWACKNGAIGYVNKYSLDFDKLSILDLTNSGGYSILNWVALLLHYRKLDDSFVRAFKSRLEYLEKHYYIDPYEYDVVIGYRADDAYFRFPLDFVRGNLTLEQLEKAYQLGKLGIQYVVMSEKGIASIKYIESFLSETKYINLYFDRVQEATEQYDNLSKDEEGVRIFDIIKEDK